MDDPELPEDVHQQALLGLARLNRVSGISGKIYRHLRQLALSHPNRTLRLLDVASGSGDLPIDWARRAKLDQIDLRIVTTDLSPTAIEIQRSAAQRWGVQIDVIEHNCMTDPLPGGFDVVTCSLFMHHLDRHEAGNLLRSMQQASEGSIIVCDLERSRTNLALVAIASRGLSRSGVVHHDAIISVRSAFTLTEFQSLAAEVLARPVQMRRLFPCRFMMTLDERVVCEEVKEPAVAFV
jgi:2-polyprenyl-3-methyl-5-hydroxy-6-metoxy-1,4-benzoquinol methylase